jgi:Putative phage serine protease XkdF
MSKSQVAVAALAEMDPQFAELVEVLFGKSVDAHDVWQFVYTPEGVSKMLEVSEQSSVSKMGPTASDLHVNTAGGRLVQTLKRRKIKSEETRKSDDGVDVVWEGTFSKLDDDKHVAFGWASVVSVNGEPVVDKQGDLIDWEDLEKAAYAYVMKSRRGGSQHRRDGEEPFHASDMIESFVVTPEKIEKMHLPPETPVGWWVGYHYHDEDTWQDIKKGLKTGFSVHGRGKRRPMEANA